MSQGIFINGSGRRPKSKKEIKEAIATNPSSIYIQATSVFGNEYDGPASELPEGAKVYFVGPDPFTKRSFYGSITRSGGKLKVS